MLGELCALGAAVTWALSVILFKRSEQVSPAAMNLFKNVVALLLLLATMPLFQVGFLQQRSIADWLWLELSGVLGIALADTLMLTALRRLGASLFAVVECIYAPVMVALSVLVLDEALTQALVMGAALGVGGVLYALTERPPEASPTHEDSAAPSAPREPIRGRLGAVALGISGIVSMGIGVVIAKPILEGSHLIEVTTVRLAAGVVVQLLWVLLWPSQRGVLRVFWPSRTWRTLVPASVLGTYLAMLLWLGGFKWAQASNASVLNQASSVFTIGLAWLILGERVSRRRVAGAAMALAGAVVVMLA